MRPSGGKTAARLVRYWLPGAVAVAALALIVVGGGSDDAVAGAAGLLGAGLAVVLLSMFFRIGAEGDRDRDDEEQARRFFDEHGRWPD